MIATHWIRQFPDNILTLVLTSGVCGAIGWFLAVDSGHPLIRLGALSTALLFFNGLGWLLLVTLLRTVMRWVTPALGRVIHSLMGLGIAVVAPEFVYLTVRDGIDDAALALACGVLTVTPAVVFLLSRRWTAGIAVGVALGVESGAIALGWLVGAVNYFPLTLALSMAVVWAGGWLAVKVTEKSEAL